MTTSANMDGNSQINTQLYSTTIKTLTEYSYLKKKIFTVFFVFCPLKERCVSMYNVYLEGVGYLGVKLYLKNRKKRKKSPRGPPL